MIDLGYILRRAWRVAWRHKTLWVFGFLASLGLAGLRLGVVSRTVWERAAQELPPDLARGLLDFLISPWFIVVIVVLGLLLLLMTAGFTLLGSLARAAMVAQVQAAEERGSTGFRAGWEAGKLHIWPVLLIRLLLGIPTLLALLAGAVLALAWMLPALTGLRWPEGPLFAQAAPRLVASVCLLPAIGLLLFASIPLGVLLRLAIRACVLEEHGVRAGLRRAVETARRYPGHTALLWLVQVIVTVAVAEAYVSTMWTLAYREMHGLGLTGEPLSPLPPSPTRGEGESVHRTCSRCVAPGAQTTASPPSATSPRPRGRRSREALFPKLGERWRGGGGREGALRLSVRFSRSALHLVPKAPRPSRPRAAPVSGASIARSPLPQAGGEMERGWGGERVRCALA